MKRVALFPGQGAQFVGMAKDFLESFEQVRSRFEEASEILGQDLKKLCLEGPEDQLNATDICQAALLASSYSIFELLESELGWAADSYVGMAGLSLGEITALVAAGSLDFKSGVQLVSHRGKFMQEACDREPSSMTSVIGLEKEQAFELAQEIAGDSGKLVVANINAPNQIVFSGDIALLEELSKKCQENGKRAIALKVAGAFHSPYMKPADEKLLETLESLDFKEPCVPVWSNVDGEPHAGTQSIKEKLSRQIVSPVLWTDCMGHLNDQIQAYEIGAGKVLTGLMRKINRAVPMQAINTVEVFNGLANQGASA